MREEALRSFGMCVTGVGKYFISSTSHVSSLTYSLVWMGPWPGRQGHQNSDTGTRTQPTGRQTAGFIADKGGISAIRRNRSARGPMQWGRKVGSSSCRPTTAARWDKGKLQDREERKPNGQKTVNQCELWNRPQTLNNLHSCPGRCLRTCDPYLCLQRAAPSASD